MSNLDCTGIFDNKSETPKYEVREEIEVVRYLQINKQTEAESLSLQMPMFSTHHHVVKLTGILKVEIKQCQEVEVIRWLNLTTGAIKDAGEPPFPPLPGHEIIKLTGTRKPKVKHREEVCGVTTIHPLSKYSHIPINAKIFAEWED
jgi:hypothetical protein